MIKHEKTLLAYAIGGTVFGIVVLLFGQPMGWLLLASGMGQFFFVYFLVRKRRQVEQQPAMPADAEDATAAVVPEAPESPAAPTPR